MPLVARSAVNLINCLKWVARYAGNEGRVGSDSEISNDRYALCRPPRPSELARLVRPGRATLRR